LRATTVARITVSPTEHRTAPSDWRAISPVSNVTVCAPYEKLFDTFSNILVPLLFAALDRETQTQKKPAQTVPRRLGKFN
jgi:hypothetical protein